jgi:hypothetical protein
VIQGPPSHDSEKVSGFSLQFSEEENQHQPICFAPAGDYIGEGRSRGLSRGLLVLAGGQNIIREGMGIGCPAALCKGETIFSRTRIGDRKDGDWIEYSFILDTGFGWGITRRPSRALTWLMNKTTSLYMRHPDLQPLLLVGSAFRAILFISPRLYSVTPMAKVQFRYYVQGNAVDITCKIHACENDLPTVFLLNEAGADAFTGAWCKNGLILPPSGWEPYPSSSEKWFYDPTRNLHFRITPGEVSEGITAQLFWGRERTRDLCWAGYGIRLVSDRKLATATCRYTIAFVKGENS